MLLPFYEDTKLIDIVTSNQHIVTPCWLALQVKCIWKVGSEEMTNCASCDVVYFIYLFVPGDSSIAAHVSPGSVVQICSNLIGGQVLLQLRMQ